MGNMADLSWMDVILKNELCGPFEVGTDSEYLGDLKERYDFFRKLMESTSADKEYKEIVANYSQYMIDVIEEYYRGNIINAQKILTNIVNEIKDSKFAVDDINMSRAFGGTPRPYVDFFRARISSNSEPYEASEMLHIPFNKREITKNERFSISGLPCLYLGNTSYCCWVELGRPEMGKFNVSPVRVRNKKILNLAVSVCDRMYLDSYKEPLPEVAKIWLKLIIIMMATSYRVKDTNRFFKSEYIVSQQLMIICKAIGIDGIAYYSKRVKSERLALAAVNVVLFAEYTDGVESILLNDIAIEDSFNYAVYKELPSRAQRNRYRLKIDGCNFINNIGSFKALRHFGYREMGFHDFDEFLFEPWIEADDSIFGQYK